ncbi:hypothetical protein FN846DRAFT_1008016 [Sphaerosporella brunnea]|uniref:Uncharacterized protein n=1 Tax=Sphaerosporella brunnea TaxID=1250544 RepID=A0A5J5ECL9_9PEZI|nr:hypothetical protein FN846DRAFT_1008016 [Sphaerosporella brunnea]
MPLEMLMDCSRGGEEGDDAIAAVGPVPRICAWGPRASQKPAIVAPIGKAKIERGGTEVSPPRCRRHSLVVADNLQTSEQRSEGKTLGWKHLRDQFVTFNYSKILYNGLYISPLTPKVPNRHVSLLTQMNGISFRCSEEEEVVVVVEEEEEVVVVVEDEVVVVVVEEEKEE